MRHLQGFNISIKCVIGQFLASQDLIVDMIFEWLAFLVEVQTEKNEKVPQKTKKYRKLPKKTEKKPKATANFKFGTVFFRFFRFFSGFFSVAAPPPPILNFSLSSKLLPTSYYLCSNLKQCPSRQNKFFLRPCSNIYSNN